MGTILISGEVQPLYEGQKGSNETAIETRISCTCGPTSGCKTKRCSCKAQSHFCNLDCKCNPKLCTNKSTTV